MSLTEVVIDLQKEFPKFNLHSARKVKNLLTEYCINNTSIIDENYSSQTHCHTKIESDFIIPELNGKVTYKRDFKYSLMNNLNAEEFKNILIIKGEEEQIEKFKKGLFEYLNEK